MGLWQIIVPETTTNLITNPSFEVDLTGWTTDVGGGTGTAARSTTRAYFGAASVLLTGGTAGVTIYMSVTTAAASHTISAYVYTDGSAVTSADFVFWVDGAASTPDSFTSVGGGWYRAVRTVSETAAAHNTGVRALSGKTCYVDAIAFEALAYVTTFVDGTQEGCYWTGAANTSTSTRSSQSRAGGRIRDFLDDYSVAIVGMQGYSMPTLSHIASDYSLLPGGYLQSVKTEKRQFVLVMEPQGGSLSTMHTRWDNIIDTLKPDLVYPLQPVRLRYTGASNQLEISATYLGGLEGDLQGDRGVWERRGARFIAYDPYFRSVGDSALVLTNKASVANANYIIKKRNGTWSACVSGLSQAAWAIMPAPDGTVYVAGDFSNAGDANGDGIVKYNPTTDAWTSLGTGAVGSVYCLAMDAAGNLYAGGDFTSMGGVANTLRIAKWDGSNWTALGTGAPNSTVFALAFDRSGNLYAGGSFPSMGGVADTLRIAKWDGSAWSALSTGIGNTVYAIATGLDNKVYVGGTFTNHGDANGDYITSWDGSAWASLGAGMNNGVYDFAFGSDGSLYAGGTFTTAGGVAANYVAKWNGASWSALGTGTNGGVSTLYMDTKGVLHAGGVFTTAGGITLADRYALWNGSAWVAPDIDLPGTPEVYAIAQSLDALYLGFTTSGTATTSYLNTVTAAANPGSAVAYPVIKIKRSGGTSATLQWIKNETTGLAIYFNYAIKDGETVTLDLRPGKKSMTSSWTRGPIPILPLGADEIPPGEGGGDTVGGLRRANIYEAMLPGSEFATWHLLPGANNVSVYVADAGAPTMTATMEWKNRYWSVEGGQ